MIGFQAMPTTALLAFVAAALLAQPAQTNFERRTFKMPDGTTIRYGLSVPRDYSKSSPRPLVVALHPGGGAGMPYYGDQYMRTIFVPGLRELDAIAIAPDVPTRTWTDPEAEQAVMSLVTAIREEFAIDRRRIMVVGFSLGGSGTWFLSSRHPDLFTGAIVMAGRTEESVANLGKVPTYVIHSRDDQVVPFAQAEQRATALERLGRRVRFDTLSGVGHYEMGGYLGALQNGGRWIREQWGK
jgi:predicted peptidase